MGLWLGSKGKYSGLFPTEWWRFSVYFPFGLSNIPRDPFRQITLLCCFCDTRTLYLTTQITHLWQRDRCPLEDRNTLSGYVCCPDKISLSVDINDKYLRTSNIMLLAHISPIQEFIKPGVLEGPGQEMLSEGFSAEWTVQRVSTCV